MNKLKNLIIFLFVCGLTYAQDANIDLYPSNTNQEVTYGGDGKLTINDWANGNLNLIAERLYVDMKLTTLRVPIFANQTIDSPIYDDVITVIKSVKQLNPNVKIMASIANGDGYGANFHNEHKFFTQWQGCCSDNIYSLNLTSYASYLDSFMQLMDDSGIYIDYLAPFNEDPADNSDFSKVFDQMKNLGSTKKVGLERWGLRTSVKDIDDVEKILDIAGSHFYDDDQINPADWDSTWRDLTQKSAIPIWHTEATRYSFENTIETLIAGMNNILPAINAGAESIVFYQAVRRFIHFNGSIASSLKYTGFKNLVNESVNKKVIDATINGANMRMAAFSSSNTISIHITNDDNNTKTTAINILDGYSATGTATRTIWTSSQTEISNSYSLNNTKSWNITVPANSYVHLKIPVVSQNTPAPVTGTSFTPDPNRTYYIDVPVHNLRLAATGEAEDAYTTSTSTTGNNVEWQFVDKGNGSWHVQLASETSKPRLRTRNNGGETDMQATSSDGTWTYWDFTQGSTNNTFFFTLPDGPGDQTRLQVDREGDINMVTASHNGTWESFRITEAGFVSGSGSTVVHIKSLRNPDFALDGNAGGANGQDVYLWDARETNVNQQWIEIDRGNGYYSYQKMGTDYCIDGNGGGANGQNVYLWACSDTNQNQHWKKVATTGGSFRLEKRNSSAFSIDAAGSNPTNGHSVYLWSSNNNNQNQQWLITPIGSAKSLTSVGVTDNVIVYPNPILSTATVQGAANTTINIYDISGQELLTKELKTDSEVIDLTTLPTGIYYAQVVGEKSISAIKMMKK